MPIYPVCTQINTITSIACCTDFTRGLSVVLFLFASEYLQFIVKSGGFRCNISTIMLEMDRILRPGGLVYIRDSLAVISELEIIGKALGWRVLIRDTSEGPHASYKILHCDKPL